MPESILPYGWAGRKVHVMDYTTCFEGIFVPPNIFMTRMIKGDPTIKSTVIQDDTGAHLAGDCDTHTAYVVHGWE